MAVSSAGVCNDTSYFNIIYTAPKAGFKKDTCSTGKDSIKLDFDINQFYTKYKWKDSISGDSTHPSIYIKQDSIIKIYFFDNQCQAPPGIFNIHYFEKPTIKPLTDEKLCPDKTVTLDAGQQAGMTYKWVYNDLKNSNTKDTVFSHLMTVQYGENARDSVNLFTIIVENNCKDFSTKTVDIFYDNCEITIPNVITPNGDGINDYLYIKDVDKLQWEVIIFNRWGEKVYENKNYKNEPGSGFTGEGLAEGVYYYILKNKNTIKRGWVQLIR